MVIIIYNGIVIDSSQHTSTITCAAAPRVWQFSAFHFVLALILCSGHFLEYHMYHVHIAGEGIASTLER